MKRIFTACLFLFATFAAAQASNNHQQLLLAKAYHDNISIEEYWVSEKLDGVRARWDGEKLLSRGGYVIHAPVWFTQGFPDQVLDGELWSGRGLFDEINSTVRRFPPDDEEWQNLALHVFDLPQSPGTFSQRVQQMDELLEKHPSPRLHKIPQFRVDTRDELMQLLDEMTADGAEGLMLHHQDAFYTAGRSDALLKLKKWQDAEAVVIGYSEGRGKYTGMVGALIVETQDKRRFRLGSGLSDKQRADPPAIGTVVTYKYHGLTVNGLPRFASFMRVRVPAGEAAQHR